MERTAAIGADKRKPGGPTIVITEWQPGWKRAAYGLTRGLGWAAVLGLAFLAGQQYEQTRMRWAQQDAASRTQIRSDGQAAQAAKAPPERTPAEVWQEASKVQSLEGLEIQTLEVGPASTAAGPLRYQFEVVNNGRYYAGEMEFAVLGWRDGRQTIWTYPTEAQRGGGAFQLRIGRYLRSEGTVELPAGMKAEQVILRLRENGVIRASRVVRLGETAKPATLAESTSEKRP